MKKLTDKNLLTHWDLLVRADREQIQISYGQKLYSFRQLVKSNMLHPRQTAYGQ